MKDLLDEWKIEHVKGLTEKEKSSGVPDEASCKTTEDYRQGFYSGSSVPV